MSNMISQMHHIKCNQLQKPPECICTSPNYIHCCMNLFTVETPAMQFTIHHASPCGTHIHAVFQRIQTSCRNEAKRTKAPPSCFSELDLLHFRSFVSFDSVLRFMSFALMCSFVLDSIIFKYPSADLPPLFRQASAGTSAAFLAYNICLK